MFGPAFGNALREIPPALRVRLARVGVGTAPKVPPRLPRDLSVGPTAFSCQTRAVAFPAGAAGATTLEVGYLERGADAVAAWLGDGLGSAWEVRTVGWDSLGSAVAELSPSVPLSRYAAIPCGSWTLILSNGPRGTDVGLLPSQAARELGCRAVRAVCAQDEDPGFPARVLEVYGPDGAPPLASVRSIVAADDGGRLGV